MAFDQAHEHENTVIQSDGGAAIGLTDDPSALRRWMIHVAGPDVCRLVAEYESLEDDKDANERVVNRPSVLKEFSF